MNFDFRMWARRRSVRAVAMVAMVLGPIAAVPVIMATGATAEASCHSSTGKLITVESIDAKTGTATFSLADPDCAATTVTLVSYQTAGHGESYPQTRYALRSVDLTQAHKAATLHVAMPTCYNQLDLIMGTDAPATLTAAYFSAHGTLLAYDHAGVKDCSTTPPTTCPPGQTKGPDGSCSSTPPTCPAGQTKGPDGSCSSTPPTCPAGQTKGPDGSCSSTPPTCTPGQSTSCTPPTCTPGHTTPCVCPGGTTVPAGKPCPTTRPSGCTPGSPTCTPPTSTSSTPSFSTPVLGSSSSQPPVYYYTHTVLPYTGVNVPLRASLLGALALLTGGAGMILLAGRAGSGSGAHRRRA